MPRQISDALHHSKEWLTSTTGAPLRAAYDFLFPPLDELFLEQESTHDTVDWRASNARRSIYDRTMSPPASSSGANFFHEENTDQLDVWDSFSDSPWSFITSRYMIALVIVAIVNNRIQHICRPRGGGIARLSQLQRFALRLPSLVLLARSVLIFTTVVADAFFAESHLVNALLRSCTSASWRNAWLANTSMSGWALDHFGSSSRDALLRARDASALWAAFTSTCVAVISDAVVRNLDADRDEPPAFNLVGFAFLLHFHSFSPDAPANEHVYLCVLLQMLQIFSIALSRCRRPVYVPRLIISSFFGISSLLHYALAANSGRYPFLEALSRTPEIALVLVVLLTVTLHAMTMLLLEGKIQPHRLLFSRSNLPSMDEDWSLALFKLGTACMESTRLTGLDREVQPLVAWQAPYIELSSSGRIEIVDPLLSRSPAHHSHSAPSPQEGVYQQGGLSREIKEIRIEPTTHSNSSSTFGHAGLARVRALIEFVTVTLLVLRNLAVMLLRRVLSLVGVSDPSVPQWVYKVLRLARLVWHGRNGEVRRRERQMAEQIRQRQRLEQQQQYRQQQRDRQQQLDRQQQTSTGLAHDRLPSDPSPLRASSSFASLGGLSRLYRTEAPPPVFGLVQGGTSSASQANSSTWQSRRPGDALGQTVSDNQGVLSAREALVSDQGDDDDDDDEDYDHVRAARESYFDSDDDASFTEEVEVEADEVSGLLEELGSFTSDETSQDGDKSILSTQLTVRSGSEAFNRLLLAHLTRPRSQPPLTRSAYTSLVRLSAHHGPSIAQEEDASPMAQADLHLAQSLLDRRHRTTTVGKNQAESQSPNTIASASDEARRLCVVCCTEERNVICWPCRCLCLCMDCREHLASRPPARRPNTAAIQPDTLHNGAGAGQRTRDDPTHLCPTCRTPVQAFSRLYIP